MVADFRKKGKGRIYGNKILFPVAGIFLSLIMVFLVFVDLHINKQKEELISQIDYYQNQILDIQKKNQNLRDEIANADDPQYLEKIAYEQLNEQKPGEKAVIFVASDEKPAEAPKPETSWTSWLSNTWNWIKSKF
jgi:cell division protein FtsB